MPRAKTFQWLCVATIVVVFFAACGRKASSDGPAQSPQESLKKIQLSDDFHVELFVAEPLVMSPVEMVFDESGKIYVCEMLDYPEDPPEGKPALSRIVLLEDTDGDGKPDKRTVFADHLLEVSGILPWKGGLIVTSAPDILYLKDTDGDGKADLRKVLYTGFPKVNPEARVTNPRLGVDNWIYVANNGSDGKITSPTHPERPPILVRGTDFRFQMEKDLAETASGPAQFGLTMDDWGNRFLTQNTTHIRHAVVPMQYMTRAPFLEIPDLAQDISDHGRPSARMYPITKPQAWREARTHIRQHRYNENHLHKTEEVGGWFTAASGGTVYNGDVFPKEYWGSLFTGDVSGNLVHRDILLPDGVTFIAHRAKENVEFLASSDVWTRPCNFANAPDGLLYMMDIYRQLIETPESIPEEIKKGLDFRNGDTLGRIYRIVPNHPLKTRTFKSNLGAASVAELVTELASTNGWNRQTAQRLLVERHELKAVPVLRELYRTSDIPLARLHALWTLEGLRSLEPDLVIQALHDAHPGVREHALRLAEGFLPSPPVVNAILARRSDQDTRVAFQLALTLGNIKDPRALDLLTDLARDRAGDAWFRLAILSSVHDNASEFFHRFLAKNKFELNAIFLTELASLIGAHKDANEIRKFLAVEEALLPQHPNEGAAALFGMAKGLKLVGARDLAMPGVETKLAGFLNSPSDTVQKAAWELARYFELRALVEQAGKQALDGRVPLPQRAAAIRALRGGQFAAAAPVLAKVLASNPPPELQTAAVESLAAFDDAGAGPALLGAWKGYSPEARTKVVGALLNQKTRVPVLLKAIEDKQIEISALDAAARSRLMQDPDPATAGRARNLFQSQASDRAKVVESYKDALKLAGDVTQGKKVFDENCARCHMPRQQGGRVGPDLSGINNKTREELLTSILNPSYAIEPRFVHYIVTTKDGHIYDGVIANETPGSLTLRGGSDEGDETILRKNIGEVRASSISLMPEDLEKSMSKQDLANVIAYLRGGL